MNSKLWTPDKETYSKLQKLLKFGDFVANLKYASKEDKLKVEKIKQFILNFDKPETIPDWSIDLGIYDNDIRDGNDEGFYWRKWNIYYELSTLEIEAETKHSDYDLGHYGDDYSYWGAIYFGEVNSDRRVFLDEDIDEFIQDAINYKKYITEKLCDIEIDVGVWEK